MSICVWPCNKFNSSIQNVFLTETQCHPDLAENPKIDLTDGDGVREYRGDEPLERLQDGGLPWVGPAGVFPPGVDVLGVLGQRLGDLLVHGPPVVPVLNLLGRLGPLALLQQRRELLGNALGEAFHDLEVEK